MIAFMNRRVQRLPDLYEDGLPGLEGTYFLVIREPAPVVRFFAYFDGVRSGPGHRTHVRLPPAITILRTTGELATGTRTSIDLSPAAEGGYYLPAMHEPGSDTIVLGEGTQRAEFRIWYLHGRIEPRYAGAASPGNTAFRTASAVIQGPVRPPLALALGVGLVPCVDRVPNVEMGPVGVPRHAATTTDYNGRRYYGLIEFKGTVYPRDAPGTFFFRRMIRSLAFQPPRSGFSRSPGDDDTSDDEAMVYMRRGPGHGEGPPHCFDTDGPGAPIFTSTVRGHAHTAPFFREEMRAEFTQMLVVGQPLPPRPRGSGNPRGERPSLAADNVIATLDWRFAASYEAMSSPVTVTDTPDIRPTPHFSQYVGPD